MMHVCMHVEISTEKKAKYFCALVFFESDTTNMLVLKVYLHVYMYITDLSAPVLFAE